MADVIIYLAHSIDLSAGGDHQHEVFAVAAQEGHTVYDPAQAWSVYGPATQADAARLIATNLAAVENADVLIAVMEGPSIGVPIEISHARMAGTPVITYKIDLAFRSLFLKALEVVQVDNASDLVAALRAIQS